MRKIFIGMGLFFGILFILILRPVPIVSEDECKVVTGKLEGLHEGPGFDLLIKLTNDSRHFYINRGLEQALDIDALKRNLVGKEIKLMYPEHWTPLDPFKETVHVSILEFEGEKLYDETPR